MKKHAWNFIYTLSRTLKNPAMLCPAAQCILLFLGTLTLCFGPVRCRSHGQRGDTHKAVQIDALKASILSYLGMDRPPELKVKESGKELDRLFEQYREMQKLLRGNTTQEDTVSHHTHTVSTTIHPVSGKYTVPLN